MKRGNIVAAWREWRQPLPDEALSLWAFYLREPRACCRRILRRYRMEMQRFEHHRNRRWSPAQIRRYRQSISWPREREYRNYVARDRRSRVLATYHFGDYAHCLSRLCVGEEAKRERLLIRMHRDSDAGRMNREEDYRQLGTRPPRELMTDEVSTVDLVHRLRRGRTTITTFCDLGERSGVVVPVRFLGRTAWFSSGAACMALAGRAPILPVLSCRHGRRNRLFVDRPIEPELLPGETMHSASRRMTQALVALLERALRRSPEQWRYLGLLPWYFRVPAADVSMMDKGGNRHGRQGSSRHAAPPHP